MLDLNGIAERIVREMHAHEFEDDNGIRQALALVEEAGELTGAYRRWTGRARRTGTAKEFHLELADVVITSYVTAAELGHRLDVTPVRFLYAAPEPGAGWPNVLGINRAVTDFVTSWLEHGGLACISKLENAVEQCYQLAGTLGIELDRAIQDKLDIIFNRGWRELAQAGTPTRTAWESEMER